ncbi:hypothetical protein [Mollivirus kamchatka]|nr:hypothetical protein [Mollivirus kamchatka]
MIEVWRCKPLSRPTSRMREILAIVVRATKGAHRKAIPCTKSIPLKPPALHWQYNCTIVATIKGLMSKNVHPRPSLLSLFRGRLFRPNDNTTARRLSIDRNEVCAVACHMATDWVVDICVCESHQHCI